MTCSICGSYATKPILDLFDDRYGYAGHYTLWQCEQCRHREINPKPDKTSISHLYSTFYPRSKLSIEAHKPHKEVGGFRAWLEGARSSTFRWVPEKTRILDIGCGACQSLGYHKSRECDVYGIDPDENIKRIGEHFGYNVKIGVFNDDSFDESSFDYVTLDQVIEHFIDPVSTVKGVARLLKPGGLAILSTPNADGWGVSVFRSRWINWHVPYHMHFFSMRSMSLAAESAGLVVDRSFTVTSSRWLHFQWLHLLTMRAQGEASPFWSVSGNYSVAEKMGIKMVSVFDHLKVNHLITRFFDALNLGDNRLYLLRKP